MTKQVISFQQFADDLRACVLCAVNQFVEARTGQPLAAGWCTLEMQSLLTELEQPAQKLAQRINAQRFDTLEILVPDAAGTPVKLASHPAWFWKFRSDAGARHAGFIIGRDLRDAVSRVLTSTLPNGQLFGEAYQVPIDVLDEAPGNRQSTLVLERPGLRLEFHSL